MILQQQAKVGPRRTWRYTYFNRFFEPWRL